MPRMSHATTTVADIVAILHGRFDPETAEEWDRVGLVVGDPHRQVRRIMFAVDPLPAVVAEALRDNCDLLVVHHPLLLRGVHGVAATDAKGRAIHDLIQGSCALLTMHTNADAAVGGVNDALADAAGMRPERSPLRPIPDGRTARVTVHVPPAHTDALVAAMASAGAGSADGYDFCAYWADETGQFRALPGTRAELGPTGVLERIPERRIDMQVPLMRIGQVVHAIRSTHPYEEPNFSIVEEVPLSGSRGMGRIGAVEETTVGGLAERLADALPPTAHGVRVAGDAGRPVHKVAVCGGAGDSLLGTVRGSGADAYVTSDLRHHPATEFRADSDIALLDIAHWAGEWLWLRSAADDLAERLHASGATVAVEVSELNTDAWTFTVAREGFR